MGGKSFKFYSVGFASGKSYPYGGSFERVLTFPNLEVRLARFEPTEVDIINLYK